MQTLCVSGKLGEVRAHVERIIPPVVDGGGSQLIVSSIYTNLLLRINDFYCRKSVFNLNGLNDIILDSKDTVHVMLCF